MNTIQHRSSTHTNRLLTALAAASLVVGLGALPAAARQDPGPANPVETYRGFCEIQRVGTQYVACDNLTGNGVPAPPWVDER